jgi:endothelin-converting enzyme
LHDYFEWRLIATWDGRLHRNYTAPLRRFSNVLSGKEPDVVPDRWRTCIGEVDANLGHLLSATFIQRAFTKKDKELGDQIIHDIKDVFRENLKSLDWMSDQSKEVAAKKGNYNLISAVFSSDLRSLPVSDMLQLSMSSRKLATRPKILTKRVPRT